MTNEEAIEVIEQDIPCERDTDLIEALNTAIAALKAEPCGDCDKWETDKTACQKCGEPCEDAVKREAVLNTLDAMDAALDENRTVEAYKELLKECYKELPPVTFAPTECEDAVSREFIELIVEYPPAELCTYPEYRGKPYFSIKYRENGQEIIGYGTYNPDVMSRFLRDYFIKPPVTPKPKTGHWIRTGDYLTTAYGSIDYVKCSCCGEDSLEEGDFCPNCGSYNGGDSNVDE